MLLQQATKRKLHGIASILMTLNVLEGHLSIVSLFVWAVPYICVPVGKILTDMVHHAVPQQ